MSTLVTDVEVHSAADRATVTITRGWSSRRGKVEGMLRTAMAALCHHCGQPPESDGDHSCPCPHSDADCPNHPAPEAGAAS